MNANVVTYAAISVALLALAWGCWAQSRYHNALAIFYRRIAKDWEDMAIVYGLPKDERRIEAKERFRMMALCDPIVRDGMYDALHVADEHWGRLEFDPERGEPQ